MISSAKRILLVGHCNVDGPHLQSVLSHDFNGAQVARVNSQAELEQACATGADLLLVNRVPVGFDIQGLDIIRDVRQRYPEAKVMLISDFPDAQVQALLAGAIPGFGKSQVGTPNVKKLLAEALD